MTAFFRFFADTFFGQRYGHRALVLETVAGVPGMVGGMLTHLMSLRRLERGNGHKIQELLDEATNERKHLMFFMEVVQPSLLERIIIIVAQFVFWHYYLVLYILFPKTAHRMVGYFEDEAVRSYTSYLELIESGDIEDTPAPQISIESGQRWRLGALARTGLEPSTCLRHHAKRVPTLRQGTCERP